VDRIAGKEERRKQETRKQEIRNKRSILAKPSLL
jgi:hypothetical protein